MVVPPKTAIPTVLDAYIGKFHDSSKVNFIPHEFFTNSIGASKESLQLLSPASGQEQKEILKGGSPPLFGILKDFEESCTTHNCVAGYSFLVTRFSLSASLFKKSRNQKRATRNVDLGHSKLKIDISFPLFQLL